MQDEFELKSAKESTHHSIVDGAITMRQEIVVQYKIVIRNFQHVAL
jgi:hypothetical protein